MKTLTMRVDDSFYQIISAAADGQKRNISNFIKFATMQYLNSSQYVDNTEMQEILDDKDLMKSLQSGFEDVANGDYTIV